ncbi:MAG: pilus assembly protein PilM [Patescibacteria group bacterium]
MATVPIGLEINENRIRIADARFKDGVIYLQALGLSETLPMFFANASSDIAIQKQAMIIHTLCTDLKIANKPVNVVLPDSITYSQIVETPVLAEKELITAIRYLADEFIPMNIDETYLDLEILKTDTVANKLEILIVAAPKRIVDGVFKAVELSGLTPNRLETEVSAVGRLVSEVMKTKDFKEAYCIVNVGYTGSSIYLIDNSTHRLVFIRSSKMGYDLILKEVMVNLNLDQSNAATILQKPGERSEQVINAIMTSAKEIANEIKRIVDVFVHKNNVPVNRVFTVNYSSQIYGFTALLERLTGLNSEPLPLNTVYVPNTVLKVFSSEITEFASVVSTTMV